MSKSQKEIAAPKACNKFFVPIISAAACVTFIMLFAFFAHAYVKNMFAEKTALTVTVLAILIVLSVACLAAMLVARRKFKTASYAAVFGFYAVLSTILVLGLALLQLEADRKLFGIFTLSMLYLLLSCSAIISITAVLITKNRTRRDTVYALILCCIFSLSAVLMFYLRFTPPPPAKVANKLWSIAAFSSIIAITACVVACVSLAETRERQKITTKWLTYCATFAALGVVCKMIGNAISITDSLKITLVYIPWVVSGIVLGPVGGMASAFVSDIVGQLLVPSGAGDINPFIVIANTLFPLFPALFYKFFFSKEKKWLSILIGMTISLCVCTLGISSFGQWLMYNKHMNYLAFMATKAFSPLVVAVNYLIIISLLPALRRAKLTELKFLAPRANTKT